MTELIVNLTSTTPQHQNPRNCAATYATTTIAPVTLSDCLTACFLGAL
jgi:hypothetical protein